MRRPRLKAEAFGRSRQELPDDQVSNRRLDVGVGQPGSPRHSPRGRRSWREQDRSHDELLAARQAKSKKRDERAGQHVVVLTVLERSATIHRVL